MAQGAGVLEEQWDQELSGAPFHVQSILQVRANCFAMVGACHLGSWQLYNNAFMDLYTQDVGENFRFPTVQEAEEADQTALRAVYNLCYAGAKLDDALSTIAIDRDMLRPLLMPRPKALRLKEREPIKRKRLADAPKPGGGDCKLRKCKFLHKCSDCGSSEHHSAVCTKKKVQ